MDDIIGLRHPDDIGLRWLYWLYKNAKEGLNMPLRVRRHHPIALAFFWEAHSEGILVTIIFAFTFLVVGTTRLSAQNVGIGTAVPNSTALLDLTSTTEGLLVPRMTNTQMLAISSPATGDLVFNTTYTFFYYYNGTAWVPIYSSTAPWGLLGNAGTVATTNFLGTTDSIDFRIKTDNTQIFALTATGNIGVGATASAPTQPFVVIGDAGVNIHTIITHSAGTKTGVAMGGDNEGTGYPTTFGSVQAYTGASGTSVGTTCAIQADLGGKVVIGDTLPSTMLDVAGDIDIRTSTVTPSSTNTALSIGSFSFIRLTPTAAFSIAGVAGGVDGKIVVLFNEGTFNMTILNESATATAANRIECLTGANIVTTGQGTVTMMYSAADSRWIVIGSAI
jgi:hypothetical protein